MIELLALNYYINNIKMPIRKRAFKPQTIIEKWSLISCYIIIIA
jgi:hypothetical protein